MSRRAVLRWAVAVLGCCLMVAPRMYGLGFRAAGLVEMARVGGSQEQLPPGMHPPLVSDIAPTETAATDPGFTAEPSSASPGAGLQVPATLGRSVPWSIIFTLTFLTLIPSILICMTPFARLLIVFHFLRQALGLQTTPSNQTLIGLSVIFTFFLMQPVAARYLSECGSPDAVR